MQTFWLVGHVGGGDVSIRFPPNSTETGTAVPDEPVDEQTTTGGIVIAESGDDCQTPAAAVAAQTGQEGREPATVFSPI